MNCNFVTSTSTLAQVLSAQTEDEFRTQFRDALKESKDIESIVYVWRTVSPIPRLKGSSDIIYIGKTIGSLYSRYINIIEAEIRDFWDRYRHIISEYGPISFDIYTSTNPKITENNFLYQYRCAFMETPPINTQSYKNALLEGSG